MVEGQLSCEGGGSKRSEDGCEDGWRTARWRERGMWLGGAGRSKPRGRRRRAAAWWAVMARRWITAGPGTEGQGPCWVDWEAGKSSMVRQRPIRQCGQDARSMPATRLRKAAASSWAWAFGAGTASAARAAAMRAVLTAGLSRSGLRW